MIKYKNIFSSIPSGVSDEIFETIIKTSNVKIERIISHGQATPEKFWYDQDWHEWVIVMQGQAKLRFHDDNELVEMNVGDYINIPANTKHRVEWTPANEETIWLAVHYV